MSSTCEHNIGKRRVFYVVPCRFPEGSPGAARVLGVGRALRKAGWEVAFVVGAGSSSEPDRPLGERLWYDGFEYSVASVQARAGRRFSRRGSEFLRLGQASVRCLESFEPGPGDVIVAYDVALPEHLRLQRLSRSRNVAFVIDCAEWYDPSHLTGGRLGPLRFSEEWRMRIVNKRADGVIAISSFLQRYYAESVESVVCVPPLIDTRDQKWLSAQDRSVGGRRTLVYAGVPGRKDLFGSILAACSLAEGRGARFRLVVAGPEKAEVAKFVEREGISRDAYEKWLEVLGPVPQREVPKLIGSADYTVLLRPPFRYAMAGFPTKVVETLAAGTAPIVNITSDLGEYIEDGVNGIVAADHSVAALASAIERAVAAPVEEVRAMGRRARETAERCFDFRVFVDVLDGFFTGIVRSR